MQDYQRKENEVKEVLKVMKTLLNNYKESKILSVKSTLKTVTSTKNGVRTQEQKTSLAPLGVSRSGIPKRFDEINEGINMGDPKFNHEKDFLSKTYVFAGINMMGTVTDVASYLSKKFSHGSTTLDENVTMYSVICFLIGLIENHSDSMINYQNCKTEGPVRVLNAFEDYMKASDDKQKDSIAQKLYAELVTNIIDQSDKFFRNILVNSIGTNNIGNYNSNGDYRNQVNSFMIQETRKHAKDVSSLFIQFAINGGTYYNSVVIPSRLSWLETKGFAKEVDKSSIISIDDIPALAVELGVISENILGVPTGFKEKNGTEKTVYTKLGLDGKYSHVLAEMFGINAVMNRPTGGEERVVGSKGKKVLTANQIVDHYAKQFSGYLSVDPKTGMSNIQLLSNRAKYLDIVDAEVQHAQGITLGKSTDNTVFILQSINFPSEAMTPGVLALTAGNREANKEVLLTVMLFTLGFRKKDQGKVPPEVLHNLIKDLYEVFGKTYDGKFLLNYNPTKQQGVSSNNFLITAPIQQQPMVMTQTQHGAQTGLFSQSPTASSMFQTQGEDSGEM